MRWVQFLSNKFAFVTEVSVRRNSYWQIIVYVCWQIISPNPLEFLWFLCWLQNNGYFLDVCFFLTVCGLFIDNIYQNFTEHTVQPDSPWIQNFLELFCFDIVVLINHDLNIHKRIFLKFFTMQFLALKVLSKYQFLRHMYYVWVLSADSWDTQLTHAAFIRPFRLQ